MRAERPELGVWGMLELEVEVGEEEVRIKEFGKAVRVPLWTPGSPPPQHEVQEGTLDVFGGRRR